MSIWIGLLEQMYKKKPKNYFTVTDIQILQC